MRAETGATRARGLRWQPRERHKLTAAALAILVACPVPPVTTFARRYVFVESIQFVLFAMVAPGLLVPAVRGWGPPRRRDTYRA